MDAAIALGCHRAAIGAAIHGVTSADIRASPERRTKDACAAIGCDSPAGPSGYSPEVGGGPPGLPAITDGSDKVKSLEDQVKSLDDQVKSLEDQVRSLDDKVKSLEDQMGSLDHRLRRVETY